VPNRNLKVKRNGFAGLDRGETTRKVAVAQQWRLIRELIRQFQNRGKVGQSRFLREMMKLEPIYPYNRLHAAETLRKGLMPSAALKILERGRKNGERHPLYDYERVLAHWALGRKNRSLELAKWAAKKWKCSPNTAIVGYIYLSLGEQVKGDRWVQKAAEQAEAESTDENIYRIDPRKGR